MTRTSRQGVLVLILASPLIAELLSSSAPPMMFFIPWVFLLFVMFYGGAAVVIRELALRWNSGWIGILLMGAAFGILQEGCSTRAFFDPAWPSLGPMANHGRWLGVNWIWTADALLYHALYSIAIPILLVYQLVPESRHEQWLSIRELVMVTGLFALALSVWLYSGKDRYPAPHLYLWLSAATAALLFLAAAKVKAKKPWASTTVRPRSFAVLGFVVTIATVLHVYAVPRFGMPALTILMLVLLVAVTRRLLIQWSGCGAWSRDQQFGLLAGVLSSFALLDFFQEFDGSRGDTMRGVSLVGIATLCFVGWMNRRRKHACFPG